MSEGVHPHTHFLNTQPEQSSKMFYLATSTSFEEVIIQKVGVGVYFLHEV